MAKVLVVKLNITVVDTAQVTTPSEDDTFETYEAHVVRQYRDPQVLIEALARACADEGDAEAISGLIKDAAEESRKNDGAEVHRRLVIKRDGYRVSRPEDGDEE